jgi:putative addiction module killer protein
VQPEAKQLVSYETPSNKVPFDEWIKNLKDRKGQELILARLRRFAVTGHPGDHKSIGRGVYELRIHYGPGYRIYYGEDGMMVVLLLCGGDKSSQRRDIQRAEEYWKDYRSRR